MLEFLALAQECAPWVAPRTMAAIVKTESGFKPFAIGINGGAKLTRQPATKEEAEVTARWLIASGYNIDLGLGQVNSANLKRVNLSVEDAFDPCKNIAAAATILQGSYLAAKGKTQDEQSALHAALSAYNTGSFSKGFANGYVQKVINNASGDQAEAKGKAIEPIPLVAAARAIKPASNPSSAPVRLKAEPSSDTSAGVSPQPSTKSVMVY